MLRQREKKGSDKDRKTGVSNSCKEQELLEDVFDQQKAQGRKAVPKKVKTAIVKQPPTIVLRVKRRDLLGCKNRGRFQNMRPE